MDYKKLSKEDFDAVVTGELTHIAIWFEDEINSILCNYFVGISGKKDEFKKYILYRDGITFKDKIDILRSLLPFFGTLVENHELKHILKKAEEFKNIRNAVAHGLSVSDEKGLTLKIEVVSRSGKTRVVTITPESHKEMYKNGEILIEKLSKAREELNNSFVKKEIKDIKKLLG